MSALPPIPSKDNSFDPISNDTSESPQDNLNPSSIKTDQTAKSNLGVSGKSDSKITASATSSNLAKPAEESVFKKLPTEIVERILHESGNFESFLVTSAWSEVALDDHIWRNFADKLGLAHLKAEPGKLHTVIGNYCGALRGNAVSLKEATADVKALGKGPLTLDKMLKLVEWKENRDKIVIMQKLAEQCSIEGPDKAKLTTMEGMIEEGGEFSSWIENNRNPLQSIKKVDLQELQLTSLPEVIGEFNQLEQLNVGGNQLTYLPQSFCQLKNLWLLDLSHNVLTSLPEDIKEFSLLTALKLANNQLTSLPAKLGELENLSILDLNNNLLSSLPEEFKYLGLTSLGLDSNMFAAIPAVVRQISSLRTLTFNGTTVQLPRNWQAMSDNDLLGWH